MAESIVHETVESIPAIFQNDFDKPYCKEILQNLNSLRQESSLCDVTLVVEGREFRAHRNVLAASSSYFRTMFTSDVREKTENKVAIEALTSSVMEDLLSYLYTGNVEITNESRARDLLFAADYLVVPRLNKIAGEFLLKNLSVWTCINVYKLAVATRNKVLGDGTLNFINKNFVLVSKSEEFLNLSADEVIEWVSSDDVEIRSEDEMFEVVISWVEHSPDRRKECLLGLLRYVRLTLVTPSYLHSKILKNGLIEDSKDCVKLVLKSMENLANQQDGSLCENPRKCLETHVHCLLACGGHTKTPTQPSDLTCCFVPDTGKWYRLTNMIWRRTFHAVVSCQGFVYSLDGLVSGAMSKEVERFDPTFNLWAKIAPLPTALGLYTGVTALNGLLYVCGGTTSWGKTRKNSKNMFAYNTKTNTWQECAPMVHGRQGLCALAADQHIYAIGGREESGSATDTVQRFDPWSNMWMLVSSMTEKRSFSCGAIFKNKIVVFGGCPISNVGTASAEVYDTGEDQWQTIPNMQVPRFCAGAAVVQGQIYIIGGNKPPSTAPDEHKRMIECYNPSTGQWAEKGFFPYEEFIKSCTCCPVLIPKNVLKSLPELHT